MLPLPRTWSISGVSYLNGCSLCSTLTCSAICHLARSLVCSRTYSRWRRPSIVGVRVARAARGIPAQRATSAPPPNAPNSLPCLLNDPEPLGTGAPGRWPDLRVNVPKCPRMSHYFAPPLVNPLHLRVENLTFWADSRPFWPISVHFRLTRRHSQTQTPVILVPRHGNPCPLAPRRAALASLPLPVAPPARPYRVTRKGVILYPDGSEAFLLVELRPPQRFRLLK